MEGFSQVVAMGDREARVKRLSEAAPEFSPSVKYYSGLLGNKQQHPGVATANSYILKYTQMWLKQHPPPPR